MNIPSLDSFDPTSGFYEIGLMAAASPDFADTMIRALLAAGEELNTPSEVVNAPTTQAAA